MYFLGSWIILDYYFQFQDYLWLLLSICNCSELFWIISIIRSDDFCCFADDEHGEIIWKSFSARGNFSTGSSRNGCTGRMPRSPRSTPWCLTADGVRWKSRFICADIAPTRPENARDWDCAQYLWSVSRQEKRSHAQSGQHHSLVLRDISIPYHEDFFSGWCRGFVHNVL